MTSNVVYDGNLRTVCIHKASDTKIETDAPVDNQGKGERFSPSDLVATALGSCMMTIMGQVAAREGVNMNGLKTEVVKVMTASPRKIAEIKIAFSHPDFKATDVQKQKLENAARTCPVALSLSDSLKQTIIFNW
jgi:uncharacterized OsmC-like protein